MAYVKESELRKLLAKTLDGSSRSSVARAAGIRPNVLSMMSKDAPITGKLLRYLGSERVKERLYRRVK